MCKTGTDSLQLVLSAPAAAVLMGSLTECLARRRAGDELVSVTLDRVTVEQHHEEWRPLEAPAVGQGCPTDCDGDE